MSGTGERVVVGFDGSAESAAAAAWAGHEAAARATDLHLVTVWSAPPGAGSEAAAMRAWEGERLAETAELVQRTHPALTVTAAQVDGAPRRVLLEQAREAGTLVLGSRRLGGVASAFYGSVNLHVLGHCDQPVVLVGAQDAWAREDATRIVLGVDPHRPCDELVSFAFREAAVRGVTLHAVRVWEMHRMYGSPVLDRELEQRLRGEQLRALAAFLAPWRAQFAEVEVAERVPSGPVVTALVEEARSGTALLVVGRRRRPVPAGVRIGHVTHGVVHHAPCPVAVVSHA